MSMYVRAMLAVCCAVGLTAILAGCGGGGGGTTTSTSSSATSYTAAATAGELLTYTLDTSALTYSYTITDSQFGLNGKTASGTLVRNSDGTYTPSGITGARIAVLPNGLLLGAIRENINGTTKTIPVLGMSTPVSNLSEAAGLYNFVQRSCVGSNCFSAYGTYRINANGTWESCESGDLASGCAAGAKNGTFNSLGNGKWQVMHGVTNIGTAIAFSSGGQNVVILDLKDTRNPGFGVGILVGSSRQTMDFNLTNGTWAFSASDGNWGIIGASGSTLTCQMLNGRDCSGVITFSSNAPWEGMATRTGVGYGLLAGTGVYLFGTAGGYFEMGIKIN